MAISAAGKSLEGGCSSFEADADVAALQKVHAYGILHCDIRAANFVQFLRSDSNPPPKSSILVIDFEDSGQVPSLKQEACGQELGQLDTALIIGAAQVLTAYHAYGDKEVTTRVLASSSNLSPAYQ